MPPIKKILVFGNPLVKKDSLPLKLINDLRKEFPKIEFKEFDAVEDLEREGRDLYILDAVEYLREAEIITDIDIIATSEIYSVHDFDLAYTLKLLKKMGLVGKVTIFGVPMNVKKEDVLKQVKVLIKSTLSSRNGWHNSCTGHKPL